MQEKAIVRCRGFSGRAERLCGPQRSQRLCVCSEINAETQRSRRPAKGSGGGKYVLVLNAVASAGLISDGESAVGWDPGRDRGGSGAVRNIPDCFTFARLGA